MSGRRLRRRLSLAAMNGHEEVVRFLLEKGASADVKDTFYKASALDFVLTRKYYGVAKMLVRKGRESRQRPGLGSRDRQCELVQAFLETGKPSQAALDKHTNRRWIRNRRTSPRC